MTHSLVSEYGLLNTFRCLEDISGDYRTRRSIPKDCQRCAMIGHVPFGIGEQFGIAAPRYFTLLRDPFSRLQSHYYYVMSNPKHYLHGQLVGKGISFAQYISQDFSPELSNGMVRQLCGHAAAWEDAPDFELLYQAAKTNLDAMTVFGLMEEYLRSLYLFADRLGWRKPPKLLYQNSSHTQSRVVPDEVAELVYTRNKYDYRLYRHARQQFDIAAKDLKILPTAEPQKWEVSLVKHVHRIVEFF